MVIIKGIIQNETARKVIFYKSIMREIFNKVIMVDFFGVAATKTTLVFAKIVSNHYYQNHKKVSVI